MRLSLVPMFEKILKGIKLGFILSCLAFAIIFLAAYYAIYIEPLSLSVKKVQLHVGLDEPVKLAFISDIHVGSISDDFLKNVVEKVNEENPDYVLLGGDFVDSVSDISRLAPLQKLKAKKGIFAVLGNHDYGFASEIPCPSSEGENSAGKVAAFLESANITVLRNNKTDLLDLSLIGIDDFWACRSDYQNATLDVDRSRPMIVLTHNQESIPLYEYNRLNLVLAGHTHCGSIRLPILGSVPKLFGFKGDYDAGLHQFDNDSYIYTTCGIGVQPRFLAPPEITVIELT